MASDFHAGWAVDDDGQTVPSVDCLTDYTSGSTQCVSGVVVTPDKGRTGRRADPSDRR